MQTCDIQVLQNLEARERFPDIVIQIVSLDKRHIKSATHLSLAMHDSIGAKEFTADFLLLEQLDTA
jgi:hypothetical protein